MKSHLLSVIFPIYLMTTESMSDLRIAVDPTDAKNRSHIDFISQTSFDMGSFNFLVNPELAFYLNRSVDFGLSLGHRWPTRIGAFGHHVFFDRSQMPKISVNQFGSGIDWLTPNFDLRANYYHPISPAITLKDRLVKPCRWLEVESVFKNRYFNIGVGPTYNIDSGIFGIQSRFVVPFERFSLGLGGTVDQAGKNEMFLLTSFHLYRDKSGEYLNMPASHTKRPKIDFIPIKIKQKKLEEPKKEEPKKFDEADLHPAKTQETEETDDFDKSVREYWEARQKREIEEEKQSIVPPALPLQPEEKSIWQGIKDFFLGTANG